MLSTVQSTIIEGVEILAVCRRGQKYFWLHISVTIFAETLLNGQQRCMSILAY
jgi:hypothetical protein